MDDVFYDLDLPETEYDETDSIGEGEMDSSSGCLITRAQRLDSILARMPQIYTPPQDLDDKNCFLKCLLKAKEECLSQQPPLAVSNYSLTKNYAEEPRYVHLYLSDLQFFANLFCENYAIYMIQSVPVDDLYCPRYSHTIPRVQTIETQSLLVNRADLITYHFLWYEEIFLFSLVIIYS